MALFGNKEDKGSKAEALLEKYGLQELKDPRDLESVRQIASALVGNKLIELGTALQGNGADAAKMTYLHALR